MVSPAVVPVERRGSILATRILDSAPVVSAGSFPDHAAQFRDAFAVSFPLFTWSMSESAIWVDKCSAPSTLSIIRTASVVLSFAIFFEISVYLVIGDESTKSFQLGAVCGV